MTSPTKPSAWIVLMMVLVSNVACAGEYRGVAYGENNSPKYSKEFLPYTVVFGNFAQDKDEYPLGCAFYGHREHGATFACDTEKSAKNCIDILLRKYDKS